MFSALIGKFLASSLILSSLGGIGYGTFVFLNKSEGEEVITKTIEDKIVTSSVDTKRLESVELSTSNPVVNSSNEDQEFSKRDETAEKKIEDQLKEKEPLLLEVIWEKRVDDKVDGKIQRKCFILTESESSQSVPDMKVNNSKSDEYCNRLKNRSLKEINRTLKSDWKEAFWIEGDKEKVSETIKNNWTGLLKDVGFSSSEELKKNNDLFKELKTDLCNYELFTNNESIAGVTCIRKDITNISLENDQFDDENYEGKDLELSIE